MRDKWIIAGLLCSLLLTGCSNEASLQQKVAHKNQHVAFVIDHYDQSIKAAKSFTFLIKSAILTGNKSEVLNSKVITQLSQVVN